MKTRITCRYCHLWIHLVVKHIKEEGWPEARPMKECEFAMGMVGIDTPICHQFHPADRFWCDKKGYQMETNVCLLLQESRKPGCIRCTQGRMVARLVERYGDQAPAQRRRVLL